MPIPPPPKTYQCPTCGWSKTVAPRSDALTPGDYFGACPGCGHAPLDVQPATALQALKARTAFGLKSIFH